MSMRLSTNTICSRRRNDGLALVAVLWLVLVLTAIVATAGRTSRLDTKVRVSRVDEVRCRWAGLGGVEKAVGLLNEDKTETETDCLTDLWSDNAEDLNDILLEECLLNIKVVDEASKLNINTATREQLITLPYITDEIIDAIIDWRDTDEEITVSGAEAGYYLNLPYPYLTRNEPFRTIRELLMVKGITKELLYGEDLNFNDELDYNENDGDQSLPYDNGDGILDRGWIAYLTCYSAGSSSGSTTGQTSTQQSNTQPSNTQPSSTQPSGTTQTSSTTAGAGGMVNVNTASSLVLAALMGGVYLAWQAGEAIVAYREMLLYGIEDVQELQQIEGMSNNLFDQISESITVSSDVYMIRCWATAARGADYSDYGLTVVTEAVVNRSESPCQILYWYQGAAN